MAPPKSRQPGYSRKAQFSLFTGYVAAGAGALACTAAETIHPGMSWENVDYILDNTGMSKKA